MNTIRGSVSLLFSKLSHWPGLMYHWLNLGSVKVFRSLSLLQSCCAEWNVPFLFSKESIDSTNASPDNTINSPRKERFGKGNLTGMTFDGLPISVNFFFAILDILSRSTLSSGQSGLRYCRRLHFSLPVYSSCPSWTLNSLRVQKSSSWSKVFVSLCFGVNPPLTTLSELIMISTSSP